MARSIIATCGTALTVNDGATLFTTVAGIIVSATEANSEIPVRKSGTFKNAYVFLSANTDTATSTVTLRKNRADTSLIISIGGSQTGAKEDTTNTVSFTNTDEAMWEITAGATGPATSLTVTTLAVQFSPTTASDCVSIMQISSLTDATANRTNNNTPNGSARLGVTENTAKYRIRFSCTASNFYALCTANTRPDSTVCVTRKNGADGAQTFTYTTTQTGVKEDTTNTDSLVAGDDYCQRFTLGAGAGSITIAQFSLHLTSTSDTFALLASSINGVAVTFNTTTYTPIAGNITVTTTEANTQVYPQFDFTAKELGTYVTANTIATSPSTVTLRDNTADSSVTVSYSAAQTGLKNDSTNTTVITSGTDKINYKIATPNTSGSITFAWLGILGTQNSAETDGVISSTFLLMGI